MGEKFIVLLTDEDIILHQGPAKTIYKVKEGVEAIQSKLTTHLLQTPKTAVLLLIDRYHQDIKEDPLPPLFFWDRIRLLHHKQAEWANQAGFYGHHFFKQDGKSFLQWVHISLNDPLASWLFWITGLPNPCAGIRFVSLEAGQFLKQYNSVANPYQLMIYKMSHKERYVIFKNKRLLLYRPFSGEDELNASLHFLSRLYPDI